MIVSIHQPAYLSWLGYFDKIARSDVHIFLDDVKYSKNNLFNRNKIKTPAGAVWLTVPIKYKSNLPISATLIDNNSGWSDKHWKTIQVNYSRTPFFKKYEKIFADMYSRKFEYLSELNININKTIADLFVLKTKFIRSSELKVSGTSNEKLINLCRAVGADTYLSGQGAKAYMDDMLFRKNGLKVSYQHFNHPSYKQPWGEFIPNLSAIDYLFNCRINIF